MQRALFAIALFFPFSVFAADAPPAKRSGMARRRKNSQGWAAKRHFSELNRSTRRTFPHPCKPSTSAVVDICPNQAQDFPLCRRMNHGIRGNGSVGTTTWWAQRESYVGTPEALRNAFSIFTKGTVNWAKKNERTGTRTWLRWSTSRKSMANARVQHIS